MSKTTKLVIQVILTVLFLLIAFAWLPEISGWLGVIAAAVIVPVKPAEILFEKHNISFKKRVIVDVAILVICIVSFLITRGYW